MRMLLLTLCLCMVFSALGGAGGVFAERLSLLEDRDEMAADMARQQAAHRAMYEMSSASSVAVPVAMFQARLQKSRAGIYDNVAARTLRVRGNAGETMMSHFYVSEGWSQIPGQTGNQGIDGLFIRRGPNGGVVKFQVVDSKTGGSQLQRTKHGWQLTPEWTRYNLGKCLRAAEKAYSKNPSAELARQIADYKRMIAMIDKGYVPPARVYHAEIKVDAKSGRTELVLENGYVDFASGKPVVKFEGNPMRVDMRTPDALLPKKMLNARNKWYAAIEKNLTETGLPKWLSKRISASLRKAMQNGAISSSKEANKFVRDKVVAWKKVGNYGAVAGVSALAGAALGLSSVAHDYFANGSIDSATWKRAGSTAAVGTVAGAGVWAVQAGLTKVIARQIATYQVKHSTKLATQKLVALAAKNGASNAVKKKLAKKISSQTAKLLKKGATAKCVGAGMGVVFGTYEVYSSVSKLQRGELSKQDSVVYGSIGGLNIAGAVAGLVWGGPVVWVVGGVTLVGGTAYSMWNERTIRKRQDKEDEDRARYNAEWRRARLNKYLNDLELGAADDEKLGWEAIAKALN